MFSARARNAFSYLIGFFKNVPAEWCGFGKTTDDYVYLSCETDIGELRTIRTTYYIEEAIKAYEERIKRPPAPPEAEKLPVAPPPPPVERVTIYMLQDYPEFVGVDGRRYGPYRGGESAWVPRENAEELVETGWASWEKPPPPTVPPPMPPPEKLSLGEVYLKYYAETLERHRAEAVAEKVRTVSRVEEHEAEVIEEVLAEVSKEIPSEGHIEEAEEPSAADLYLRYYRARSSVSMVFKVII